MILEVTDLKKYYKNIKAVDGISFSVNEGEIFALLGPNGAGKTTTIKCILGLRKRDGGKITLNGSVGYLPEGKELYQSYTVKQLIEMTASITKDFDKNKCFDFVEKFDIPLSEKVGELSNGQTTQLYMSIVLSQKVQLYILDEPTWGLDPIVRNQILDLIRTVPLERNSVLYTSHILSEVEKIADRVAIMNKGKILEVGYLDDIKQKYCAIHVDKTKIIDGYKYKTTEKENIYIVKRKWAQENGFECEPVNFDVIFEAIVLSDKNSKDVTREGD